MVINVCIVAAGSAFGGVLRYAVQSATRLLPLPIPLGTLLVNVIGGFVIGLAAATFVDAGPSSERMRLLIATGFCGGFTTFSAFSLETLVLLNRHAVGWALASAALNVVLSVAACWAGAALAARA